MPMLEQVKATWKEVRNFPAGRRFETYYCRERERRGRGSILNRVLGWGGALVAVAIGIVLIFIPGPAILFFAIAGGLLAAQSLWVARALDWLELRARAAWRAVRNT